MSYNQLILDPSTYVKNRAQRSEASILLRHVDDVVGMGPDEVLMIDFEHMKTSLYLTDVVVLRHDGDTEWSTIACFSLSCSTASLRSRHLRSRTMSVL